MPGGRKVIILFSQMYQKELHSQKFIDVKVFWFTVCKLTSSFILDRAKLGWCKGDNFSHIPLQDDSFHMVSWYMYNTQTNILSYHLLF